MFKELKTMLLESSDAIISLLEFYGFENFVIKNRKMRFRRDSDGGQNISIRLDDNPMLIVEDFARGISTDIFAYIVKEKNQALSDVLQKTKEILKLDYFWQPKKKIELFEGIYNRISQRQSVDEKSEEYDKSILNNYIPVCNKMFQKDGISFQTQREFGLMYDIETQRIIIPIYDELGRLVGVKGRINQKVLEDDMPKYLYLYPCQSSKVLFGYCQNYQYLFNNDVIIGESEKMVMQAHSFGVKNVVALGGNNLSQKQARLITQLNPKSVIFALDEGLGFEQTKKNIEQLCDIQIMADFNIYFWDYTRDKSIVGTKASPTDMGKEKYEEIINHQLVKYR